MKLKVNIPKDEIKKILVEYLSTKGYNVRAEELFEENHTEGEYDETVRVFDGYSFEKEI